MKEKNLLEQIKVIQKKYYEINKITGENFNIFEAGHIGHIETFHTRLIAELLCKKGSHNQGDTFLKLFFNKLKLKTNYENTKVYSEYQTDNGRRIDIVIENEKLIIGIEAKIYAKDQDKQIQDYYTYLTNKNKKVYLIYLTLDGHLPDEQSKGEVSHDQIIIMSFKTEIYDWIILCIKEVYDKINLRESLLIYKNLLEKLTNQNLKKEIEMVKILNSKENIESAFNLFDVYERAWAEKEYNFWCDLYAKVEKNIGSQWEDGDDIFLKEKDKSVWYKSDGEPYDTEESIKQIKSLRYGSTNKLFGIAFKQNCDGRNIYLIVAYANSSEVGWLYIEIKSNDNKNFNHTQIRELLIDNNDVLLDFKDFDDTSVYKIIEEIKFPSYKNRMGNFELFGESKYKTIINKLSKELICKLNEIDKILRRNNESVKNSVSATICNT
ncbi:hypothetical protein FJR45_08805 [Sulfurimonas sediminis]|uniref:PD-(D/E)XK nuclease family protein n=1 Tax=Sulfurimonas sediminis TaxID=2590020 RepID=A0A7M1B3E3_9BACT|nr:PD-(D/E)XK nuclease family protein [Sulfurimonas sediminis]QOP44036.1 hypothetical protein FJR45_08805 [Sulfurimonas sediminis]